MNTGDKRQHAGLSGKVRGFLIFSTAFAVTFMVATMVNAAG